MPNATTLFSSVLRLAGVLAVLVVQSPVISADDATAAAIRSYALRFDSQSHVELASTVGLLKQEAPFTVELWARAKLGKGGPFPLLGDFVQGRHPEVPHPNRAGWFIGIGQTSGGTLAFQGAFGPLEAGAPLGAEEGEWCHIAAVNAPDGVAIFVNGDYGFRKLTVDEIKGKPSPINLHLGKTKYDSWRISDHQVDIRGLRISSACLYEDKFDPPKDFDLRPDTLVLLDFERINKEVILDLSGHQHHGTLRGPKWLSRASSE